MTRIPAAILDLCRTYAQTRALPNQAADGPLATHVLDLLLRAHRAGKVRVPTGIAGHSMLLEHALRDLDVGDADRKWNLERLVDWMARQVALDVDSQTHRAQRADAPLEGEALVRHVADLVARKAASGTFGDGLFNDTDLVASAWNGKRHTLAMTGWAFEVREPMAGASMRLGSVQFPVQPAFVPGRIEVEMRLRTGDLFLGADVPDAGLAALCTEMRQKADGQGLAGDIAVTRTLLGERQIAAFGVHQRSLAFVPRADGFDIVAPADTDRATNTFLLDYRHFALVDMHALRENLRENWETPNALVDARAQRAVQHHQGARFQVDPGVYRLALPANHQRALGALPNGDTLLLQAKRLR